MKRLSYLSKIIFWVICFCPLISQAESCFEDLNCPPSANIHITKSGIKKMIGVDSKIKKYSTVKLPAVKFKHHQATEDAFIIYSDFVSSEGKSELGKMIH